MWKSVYFLPSMVSHWQIQGLGGGGGTRNTRPSEFNFSFLFNFLGGISQNNSLGPSPLEMAHLPLNNPGSTTVSA